MMIQVEVVHSPTCISYHTSFTWHSTSLTREFNTMLNILIILYCVSYNWIHCKVKKIFFLVDIHESVHRDTATKITN